MPKSKAKHVVHFPAPQRCSIELENGKFYTREWLKGEKKEYENNVLGRYDQPSDLSTFVKPLENDNV